MYGDIDVFIPEIDPKELQLQKKKMRRAFSRIGWAVLVTALATFAVSLLLGIVIGLFGDEGYAFYSKNLLLLNQALITVSVLAGALVLIGMPKDKPVRRKATPKEFFVYLCICFAIGWAGNLIGSTWLTFWNLVSGNEVTNPLNEILSSVSPWQMALCTGILAPIIEEFFFRKLLIDRTRKYGELAAILMSAAFFGIFHQNFSQFFYAFGIGILLGYVYCRTGSYITVTLLHLVFNFVMGVIPSILSTGLFEFLEQFGNITEPSAEAVLALLGTYGLTILIYLFYASIQGALNIAGVVLFFVTKRKIHVEKSGLLIDAKEQRKAAIVNFGVIAAFAVLIALTVSTLFTA